MKQVRFIKKNVHKIKLRKLYSKIVQNESNDEGMSFICVKMMTDGWTNGIDHCICILIKIKVKNWDVMKH